MSKPVLITVTYNTWETYTERLVRMVQHYTDANDIASWLMCDNGSSDLGKLMDYNGFTLPHTILAAKDNIGDIPRYNRIIPSLDAEFAVILSTDCRIFDRGWIGKYMAPFSNPAVAMVGHPGPGDNMAPRHADGPVGGVWHWIPKLLVDRGIEFDNCAHIQTHSFAIRTSAFREVGGFWEPDGSYLDKGNLIAGEIALGVRLRAAGWKLSNEMPKVHHYGNRAASSQSLDTYDRNAGWEVSF